MKLVYPDFQFQIELVENCVNTLVIENPRMYSEVVKEILKQSKREDGRFVLSDNNEVIKIADNVVCIINPFSIDYNERKVIAKLYNVLKNEVQNSEISLLANKVFSEIMRFTEQVIETLDYPITYSEEMDINALFKLMAVKIDVPEEELISQIIDYIKLLSELLGYSVFVFVNLSAYLDSSEIKQLYKFALYKKIHLLMIESYVGITRCEYEKVYIIDKDCCSIY